MRLRSIVPYSPRFGNEGKKERLHPIEHGLVDEKEARELLVALADKLNELY